jgi:hypothetical protein
VKSSTACFCCVRDRWTSSAGIRANEELILARQCHTDMQALGRTVVDRDTARFEEAIQR